MKAEYAMGEFFAAVSSNSIKSGSQLQALCLVTSSRDCSDDLVESAGIFVIQRRTHAPRNWHVEPHRDGMQPLVWRGSSETFAADAL
jgi:hypothetical protein